MPILLGIDTGGTFTDAVLLDEDRAVGDQVIAKAKALTTRHDLSEGIGEAIGKVIAQTGTGPDDVALVSLSTTLATNALVEGQGGKICLIMIGFSEADLDRAGLRQALAGDPVILVAGGHGPHGDAVAPLDVNALEAGLDKLGDNIAGFAIAGQFAVRNSEHELTARELVLERTGLPVTCSHELSSKLGGPKRALTCVLNARLIGLLHRLIAACEGLLAAMEIAAPLMIVRGDGALIAADVAKSRPIETILSGPAASLVGASYLTGQANAMVSDIGGTTTDIAVLKDGRPRLDERGATVGGWQTMVEAVAMRTHGLGGDSEVKLSDGGLRPQLLLGPRRFVPVSLLAVRYEQIVMATLRRQLGQEAPRELDGLFVLNPNAPDQLPADLSQGERELLDGVADGPKAMDRLVRNRIQIGTIKRLVARGHLMISGFTPSDAAHVLGVHGAWNGEAAQLAASLFARKRDARGDAVAQDAKTMAQWVISSLHRRSADVLLDAVCSEDGLPDGLSQSTLARAAIDGHGGFVQPLLKVTVPIIGLGASAVAYYPAVAGLLSTEAVVPDDADVANAIGSVVGRIRITADATVSQPEEGRFQVHLDDVQTRFSDVEEAISFTLERLRENAGEAAREAGADDIQIRTRREDVTATVEGRAMFIESRLSATATGRPRMRLH